MSEQPTPAETAPEDDAPERTKEQRLLELANELCTAYTCGIGYDELLRDDPDMAREHLDAAHLLLPYLQEAPREERKAAFLRGWEKGKENQRQLTAEDMKRLEQEAAELRAQFDPDDLRRRYRDLQRAWDQLYRALAGQYQPAEARELHERAIRAERQRDKALFKLAQLGHPEAAEALATAGGSSEDHLP